MWTAMTDLAVGTVNPLVWEQPTATAGGPEASGSYSGPGRVRRQPATLRRGLLHRNLAWAQRDSNHPAKTWRAQDAPGCNSALRLACHALSRAKMRRRYFRWPYRPVSPWGLAFGECETERKAGRGWELRVTIGSDHPSRVCGRVGEAGIHHLFGGRGRPHLDNVGRDVGLSGRITCRP